MKLMELKEFIKKEAVPSDLIIFVCPESTFLAEQYTAAICELRNHTQNSIQSLSELDSALSLVIGYSDYTNVLKTDVFDENYSDYSSFENVIIICNKIDKKLKSVLSDYIVEVPKLVDWQVKDYISVCCPGLDKDDISWLYEVKNNDIYAISTELDKLALFNIPEQHNVLMRLRYEPDSYLYTTDIYKLTNAILSNDKQVLYDFLSHDTYTEIDPIGLTGMLRYNIKNILLVTQNSGKTLSELGISAGNANRYKTYGFTLPRLQQLIKFLASIDSKLKNGTLDMSKNKQLEYIILNTIF